MREWPGASRFALLLSCEHASDRVPSQYHALFRGREAQLALASHRGIDSGAKHLARFLAKSFKLDLFAGTMSRLLIDLNRSPRHAQLFSEFSQVLSENEKQGLREQHRDYQAKIRQKVEQLSRKRSVLHVAVHSFTPVFRGRERNTDIGILFDPTRQPETTLARALQSQLRESTSLTIHRNAPYRGVADGLPTILRKQFSPKQYSGIELEVNQKLLESSPSALHGKIAEALAAIAVGFPPRRR